MFRIFFVIFSLIFLIYKFLAHIAKLAIRQQQSTQKQLDEDIKNEHQRLREAEFHTKRENEKKEKFLKECKRFDACKQALEIQYQAYHDCIESITYHELQKQDIIRSLESKKSEIIQAGLFQKGVLKKDYNQYITHLSEMDHELEKNLHQYKDIFDNVNNCNQEAKIIADRIKNNFGNEGENWYRENFQEIKLLPLPKTIAIGQQEFMLITPNKNSKWQIFGSIMFVVCIILLIKIFFFP